MHHVNCEQKNYHCKITFYFLNFKTRCVRNIVSEECLHTVGDLELVLEQPFFTPHAAAITYKGFVAADHAVAGDDDGDIVASVRACRRPDHFGIPEAFGEVHVADGASIGDLLQFAPYARLEFSALLVNGKIEFAAGAMKIFDQLFGALVHDLCNARLAVGKLVGIVDKTQLPDIAVCTTDLQHADRAFVVRIVQFVFQSGLADLLPVLNRLVGLQ